MIRVPLGKGQFFGFRSNITFMLMETLSDGKVHTANELAEIAEIKSNEVYPRLKNHLKILNIVKIGNRLNGYQVKDFARNGLRYAVSMFKRNVVAIADRLAKKVAGYNIDMIDKKVIMWLYRYMNMTGKRWIEVISNEIDIADMIAKSIGERYDDVLNSLKTLTQVGIIATYNRRKIRLSKNIAGK